MLFSHLLCLRVTPQGTAKGRHGQGVATFPVLLSTALTLAVVMLGPLNMGGPTYKQLGEQG